MHPSEYEHHQIEAPATAHVVGLADDAMRTGPSVM
jgi:hypothetical protein